MRHHLQNNKIRERAVTTCFENYGVTQPLKNIWILQKMWENNYENWGTCFPLQVQDYMKKRGETCKKRFEGVEFPLQNENVRKKWIETVRANYDGYDYVFQHPAVKAKIDSTMTRRYGVRRVMMSRSFVLMREATCMRKYQCRVASMSYKVKSKIMDTVREKYKTDNVFQNEDIKAKIKRVLLEKYGQENVAQVGWIMDKQLKSAYNRKSFIFNSGHIVNVCDYKKIRCPRDLVF